MTNEQIVNDLMLDWHRLPARVGRKDGAEQLLRELLLSALAEKDRELEGCIAAMEKEFDTEAECVGLRVIRETVPGTSGLGPPGTMIACRRFAAPEGHVLMDDGVVRKVLVWRGYPGTTRIVADIAAESARKEKGDVH